jgi:hypothetical protein
VTGGPDHRSGPGDRSGTDPELGGSAGAPAAVDAAARRLAGRLQEHVLTAGRHRVGLDELWSEAARSDPTLIGDPERRHRLRAAIEALVGAGLITLPKGERFWDRRSAPDLPLWLALRPPAPAGEPPPGPRVWPYALEPAAAVATRPDERHLLELIAGWMRDDPRPEPVPLEERSLEIFGDEKRLTAERGKRLFTLGTLTLDLLACYETPLPFPVQHVAGSGPTSLLVLENNATFHSFLTAARALPEHLRPDLHLGWGAGNQFPVGVASVALLDPVPVAIRYFGDLDLAGLQVAVNAAQQADRLGLPPVRPASALYQWLVRNGRVVPDRSNRGVVGGYDEKLDWLPPEVRPVAADLLANRMRVAQEALGLRALRAEPALLHRALAP